MLGVSTNANIDENVSVRKTGYAHCTTAFHNLNLKNKL